MVGPDRHVAAHIDLGEFFFRGPTPGGGVHTAMALGGLGTSGFSRVIDDMLGEILAIPDASNAICALRAIGAAATGVCETGQRAATYAFYGMALRYDAGAGGFALVGR